MVAHQAFFADACRLLQFINENGGVTAGPLVPFTPTITEVLSSCGIRPTIITTLAAHPRTSAGYDDGTWQADPTNLRRAFDIPCQTMLTLNMKTPFYTACRVLIDATVVAVVSNKGATDSGIQTAYGPVAPGPHTIEMQYWRDDTLTSPSGGTTEGQMSFTALFTRW